MMELLDVIKEDLLATIYRSSVVLIIASIVGVTFALISGLANKFLFKRSGFKSVLAATFVLAYVAFLTGQYSANSRESAVGDIGPVLLGGFGALFALSFLQSKIEPTIAGLATLVFSTSFFLGTVLGGHHRELFSPTIQIQNTKQFRKPVILPTSPSVKRPPALHRPPKGITPSKFRPSGGK